MIPVLESHRQFWGRLASWPHSGQQAASRVKLHLSKVESNKDDTGLRCQAFLRTHVHHTGAHSHAHTVMHTLVHTVKNSCHFPGNSSHTLEPRGFPLLGICVSSTVPGVP